MKTPTWVIVIGICLILFGGCSVTKNIQSINMPEILEMQQKIMKNMAGGKNDNSSDSLSIVSGTYKNEIPNADLFKNMSQGMQEMFSISEFSKIWTVRFGYIGLFVAIIYILSGVFLLIKRKFSIKLVYFALILSIVFSWIQSLVLASDSSGGILAKTASFGNIFGIIIDIILIVIVVSMDKSTYSWNTKETVQ